jgi:hypothetical protein
VVQQPAGDQARLRGVGAGGRAPQVQLKRGGRLLGGMRPLAASAGRHGLSARGAVSAKTLCVMGTAAELPC